jgi:hypothetical protein
MQLGPLPEILSGVRLLGKHRKQAQFDRTEENLGSTIAGANRKQPTWCDCDIRHDGSSFPNHYLRLCLGIYSGRERSDFGAFPVDNLGEFRCCVRARNQPAAQ